MPHAARCATVFAVNRPHCGVMHDGTPQGRDFSESIRNPIQPRDHLLTFRLSQRQRGFHLRAIAKSINKQSLRSRGLPSRTTISACAEIVPRRVRASASASARMSAFPASDRVRLRSCADLPRSALVGVIDPAWSPFCIVHSGATCTRAGAVEKELESVVS
jgi:hypothetical protein